MPSRLPQIFLNHSAVLPSTKKKQGGIFSLHLHDTDQTDLNSTFTASFHDKHYKTSLPKKVIKDTQAMYRTLPLRSGQYEIPKEKRLLTSHLSTFRSAKMRSFSVDKNPQTCLSFHQSQETDNVNTLLNHTRNSLHELNFKLTPFRFVEGEFRKDLENVKEKVQAQLNEFNQEFLSILSNLRSQMNSLRKQTSNQQKKNKFDLQKFTSQLEMFKEMAEDFPSIMETLNKQI